jgi:glycosyltransferase involved in cell wall biosynthesis
MTQVTSKIRILHVFARMDRGGAETWIVNVLRTIDREKYQFDFLVEPGAPGAYDDEIRQLGGRIIQVTSPSHLFLFSAGLLRTLRKEGPYDVIHSHVHHFSGVILMLARVAGVPVRIAHSHSDISPVINGASLARRAYYKTTAAFIRRFATSGIGASHDAARSLFGPAWQSDERFGVLYCGINCVPFEREIDRTAFRSSYGIGETTLVIGHVGRFAPMKNHNFLLDVFKRVVLSRPDSKLVLIGDGPLRAEIERRAEDLGISRQVIMLGSQPDVPIFLLGMLDVFVFPSTYEGLGLSIVEAQAAGLPCVISDTIPDEADVVPGLIQRLGLSQGKEAWAKAILSGARPGIDRLSAYIGVRDSSLNVECSARKLLAVYDPTAEVE